VVLPFLERALKLKRFELDIDGETRLRPRLVLQSRAEAGNMANEGGQPDSQGQKPTDTDQRGTFGAAPVGGQPRQWGPPVTQDPYGGSAPPEELAAMKRTIDRLQLLYGILFVSSLVLLVARWTVAMPDIARFGWAVLLGSAVLTRLYRQSRVTKYNAALTGRPGPIS
jgi:hypothetical protein